MELSASFTDSQNRYKYIKIFIIATKFVSIHLLIHFLDPISVFIFSHYQVKFNSTKTVNCCIK